MKRKTMLKSKALLATPRQYAKKLVLVPMIIRKHPKPAIGLMTLGLGVATGLIWYNMKK